MITVIEAKEILKKYSIKGKPEHCLIDESIDRILAEDIYAPIPVPSFDNSAMDGYALSYSDLTQQWQVKFEIQAGDTSANILHRGEAARIFTGAVIPEGADTVVPQEIIEKKDDIIILRENSVKTGINIRQKGSQCDKDDLIAIKGTKITPGVIGLLASVGVTSVLVYASPEVFCITTGNELKEPGCNLKPGEIFNSNGPVLKAYLKIIGVKNISISQVSDNQAQLQALIEQALQKCDLLILTGGISVGDHDYVKQCLEAAGVKKLFYKVKQRPGKPLYVGIKQQQLVFALPGNPAAVLSCFNQYIKPYILNWLGNQDVWKPDNIMPLKEGCTKKKGFTFFSKAVQEGCEVKVLSGQQSFNLLPFNQANCFVALEESEEDLKPGTMVEVYYW